MGTAEDAEALVLRFCSAFADHDAEALRPFFTDDVIYHNIPIDPVVGIDATIELIASFTAMFEGAEFEILNLAVRDGVVLTERVDTFAMGDTKVTLPVMGTFEIRDGKISAWRDYFDMAQFTAQISGEG